MGLSTNLSDDEITLLDADEESARSEVGWEEYDHTSLRTV